EFKKRRLNVISELYKNKRNSLLITPHLDTVPAGSGWKYDPFAAKIDNGRIYGLGATDCKVNLAVSMEVMNSLVEDGTELDYKLIFAATADEESGSVLGLAPLLEKKILKPKAALVLDADEFEIIVAQKGLLHIKIRIAGKRAHGAYPWLGINAVDVSLKIIQDLKNMKFDYARNKYLHPATMNIGTIRGGDKVNVVADWCEVELDFRFLPGTSGEELVKRIKNTVNKHARKYKIEIEGIQKPYNINEDHPLVKCFMESSRKHGVRSLIKGSEGATVISFFQEKGIPAVAAGFGCHDCAHSVNEYLKIDNLYKGAVVLEDFLKSFRFS
ncbi:M20 family peptidase, partial [bacterium]